MGKDVQAGLHKLIKQLEDRRFSGELFLRFTAGFCDRAELTHYLSSKRFDERLPFIEDSEEEELLERVEEG